MDRPLQGTADKSLPARASVAAAAARSLGVGLDLDALPPGWGEAIRPAFASPVDICALLDSVTASRLRASAGHVFHTIVQPSSGAGAFLLRRSAQAIESRADLFATLPEIAARLASLSPSAVLRAADHAGLIVFGLVAKATGDSTLLQRIGPGAARRALDAASSVPHPLALDPGCAGWLRELAAARRSGPGLARSAGRRVMARPVLGLGQVLRDAFDRAALFDAGRFFAGIETAPPIGLAADSIISAAISEIDSPHGTRRNSAP